MASGQYSQVTFSTGDVNSDGRSDVMVSDPALYKSSVYVFYGNATNRNFPNRTKIAISGCISYETPTVADLDGNGFNDLIVTAHPCSNTNGAVPNLEVLTRNPNSSYNAPQIVFSVPNSSTNPNQIQQVLVVNGDHNTKPDLLFQQCLTTYAGACTNGVSTVTLLNTTSGAFPTCNAPAAAEGIHIVSVRHRTGVSCDLQRRSGHAHSRPEYERLGRRQESGRADRWLFPLHVSDKKR